MIAIQYETTGLQHHTETAHIVVRGVWQLFNSDNYGHVISLHNLSKLRCKVRNIFGKYSRFLRSPRLESTFWHQLKDLEPKLPRFNFIFLFETKQKFNI